MSNTFDPEDYGLSPITEQVPRNWRRQLEEDKRAAEDRAAKAEARLEELERNAVFAAAGIPNEGPFAAMRRGYEGDLTVEAIRAEFGPLLGQGQQGIQQSLAGHQQAQAMAAGAPPANTSNTATELAALRASARSRRNGANFHGERQKLGEIVTREGVEPKPSAWSMPKQLADLSP